ncbi:MAG TPA: type VI secretion protein IcmF/TssM N-terminal domain-containing protein, partial [Thermoanaerobaculia bacterium]|nr:type VI secretion protein IcmF/TssM N-terminal domain-containing protein [Thermoanaerobaculia bacterium]
MELLARLSRSLPLVLLALGLVLLAVVIFIVLLVRSRRAEKKLAAEAAGGEAAGEGAVTVDFTGLDASVNLHTSFVRGLRQLKRHVSGAGYRAEIPWILLVGEEASGKSRLLAQAGLDLPMGPPEEGQACSWWFFDRGVVLDIAPEFVLDAAGRGSDELRWRQLLRLLQKHRPERPVDGILLALPCTDLARPGERPTERLARAERKATLLAAKLRETQTRLGLRLPVYILITGCEHLRGFGNFFAELPERLRDEMFGWSSPYGIDTAYRGDWVDEAFKNLRHDLLAAQFEVFAERSRLGDGDAVFTFPDEILALCEPLKVYCDRLFKASAYHESIFARGFYFCGEDAEIGRSLFLSDLLARKVFPEHTLARPTAHSFLNQRRTALALKIGVAATALILGLGLWRASFVLHRNAGALNDVLGNSARALEDLDDLRTRQQAPDPALLDRYVFELLNGLGKINTNRYGSIFVPPSWFSPFNYQLRRAIGIAYDHIIFEALWRGLDRKARLLESYPVRAPATAEELKVALPLESNPEFIDLRDFVSSLVELERNIHRFEGLRQSEDLQDLDAVVRYVFGRPVPPVFLDESELYQTALRFVRERPLQDELYRGKLRTEAEDLDGRLFRVLFRDNPQVGALKGLSQGFDEVGVEGPDEEARLSRLLEEIQKLETTMARQDLAPLAAPTFNLGTPFDQVLGQMNGSTFLGTDFSGQVRERGTREQRLFRDTLASYGSPDLHPFLVLNEGVWQLSPDVKLLKAALSDFLRQSTSTPAEGQVAIAARLPPGHQLIWDVPRLEAAVALYEPYRNFTDHGLAAFPASLRQRLQAVAAERVGDAIRELTARAQSIETTPASASLQQLEENVHEQVDQLAAVGKLTSQLEDIFERLGRPRESHQLVELTVAQGVTALRGVDRLLDQENLYQPRQGSFTWWDGAKPLAARAYTNGDPADLPAYLESQRERITYLSREYAEPVIKAMGHGDARDPDVRGLVEKWKAISAELYKYDGKKPGNSLAVLEGLLNQDLEDIEVSNCSRTIPLRSLTGGGGDWFARTTVHLRREVLKRCQTLAGSEAVDGYAQLAAVFNQRLAGRFPFAPGLPGRTDAEADPEAIRDFFSLFDHTAPMVLAAPVHTGDSGSGAVREFVVAMQRVRNFFAPFLDGEGRKKPPLYELQVDFRVNREDEIEGNQVIRWQVESGDRRVTPREADRSLRWAFGVPVSVVLGWAKDSPFVPLDPEGEPAVDRNATFGYTGR